MGRSTRGAWQARVERWVASGLTAAEFATEIGVNPRTLTYWKWRLGAAAKAAGLKAGRPRATPRPSFVELVADPGVSAPAEGSDALEVILADGIRVRVPAQFDANALRRVVAALGAR
jgi:hypothetical protein